MQAREPINRIPTARRPARPTQNQEEAMDAAASGLSRNVLSDSGTFVPGGRRAELAGGDESDASFGFGGLGEASLEYE